MRPNPSLEPTRYGMHCLAAPGYGVHFPSAAKQRLPPRAAQLERWAHLLGMSENYAFRTGVKPWN